MPRLESHKWINLSTLLDTWEVLVLLGNETWKRFSRFLSFVLNLWSPAHLKATNVGNKSAALAFRRHCLGIDCCSDTDQLITDESLVVCTQQASRMMILIYVALCMFRELERENRKKSGWGPPKDLILQRPPVEQSPLPAASFCACLLFFPSQIWPDSRLPPSCLRVSRVFCCRSVPVRMRRPLSILSYMLRHAATGSWEDQVFGQVFHFGLKLRNLSSRLETYVLLYIIY